MESKFSLLLDVGCCLLEYRSEELNLDLTGWRGKCSLKVYIPSSDVVHYIRLLGGDVSKYGKQQRFGPVMVQAALNAQEYSLFFQTF